MNKSQNKAIILFILLLIALFTPHYSLAYGNFASSQNPYYPKFELSGYYQNYKQSFAYFDFIMPVLQTTNGDKLIFADIRLLDRQGKPYEGNVGLGYRWIDNSSNHLFGIYGYFDRRRSPLSNYFKQFTIGAEFKNSMSAGGWRGRVNGYIPFGPRSYPIGAASAQQMSLVPGSNLFGFSNIQISQTLATERAMPGVDGEIGKQFVPGFTGYVGGYYFSSTGIPNISGPRARFTYDINNADSPNSMFCQATVEVGAQYDKPRKGQVFAGLRLSFGGINNAANLSELSRHMMDRVDRDIDIVSSQNTTNSSYLLTNSSGTPLTVAVATDTTTLDNAVNNGADIVAVDGTITNVSTLSLQDNQILTGGNYYHNSSITVPLATSGSLVAANNTDLIQVASNNTIEEIDLQVSNGNTAIRNPISSGVAFAYVGPSVGSMTIKNVTSNGPMTFAVGDGSTDSNITIKNNTLALGNVTDEPGIYVSAQGDSSVTVNKIDDNQISFGNNIRNIGIQLTSLSLDPENGADGGTSSLTVGTVDNNTISMLGNGDVGVAIGGVINRNYNGNTSNTNAITLNSVSNNLIILTGIQSYGIVSLGNSGITSNPLINYTNNTDNVATFNIGAISNNTIGIAGNSVGIANLINNPLGYNAAANTDQNGNSLGTSGSTTTITSINSNTITSLGTNSVAIFNSQGSSFPTNSVNNSDNLISSMSIGTINNNLLNFNASGSNSGVFNAVGSQGNTNQNQLISLSINDLSNNIVQISDTGNTNYAFYNLAYNDTGGMQNTITLPNTTNNTITYAGGGGGIDNEGYAVQTDSQNGGIATITVGTDPLIGTGGFYGNTINLGGSGGASTGIGLHPSLLSLTTAINIFVNQGATNLSPANNGTLVTQFPGLGPVTVNPGL